MRVLIADDDSGLREILKIFMARMGHVAIVAEDGVKALNQLEKSPYDILITDGEMPEMTGFELCRVVKDRFPHIFVIGLTGSSRLREFEKAGAHTRYQKPVQFVELQMAIENHFGAKRAVAL
jgi:CheY-like chemotaxis protein